MATVTAQLKAKVAAIVKEARYRYTDASDIAAFIASKGHRAIQLADSTMDSKLSKFYRTLAKMLTRVFQELVAAY